MYRVFKKTVPFTNIDKEMFSGLLLLVIAPTLTSNEGDNNSGLQLICLNLLSLLQLSLAYFDFFLNFYTSLLQFTFKLR